MGSFMVAGLIFIGILLIVFGPFFFIWAINTLFGLGIAYTFKTWAASLILTSLMARPVYNSSTK